MKIYLKKVPADGYSCTSIHNQICHFFYNNECNFPLSKFNFQMQCFDKKTMKPIVLIKISKNIYNLWHKILHRN